MLIRFIPADAGNSSSTPCPATAGAVHPRGRGEQFTYPAGQGGDIGSSPRTRGTERNRPARSAFERFIPADAGNRAYQPPIICSTTVHPRGRGEQLQCADNADGTTGSSPRTRGTGWRYCRPADMARFIPADAGNSMVLICENIVSPVHPRGRGEQAGEFGDQAFDIGSSPRTRGTGPHHRPS